MLHTCPISLHQEGLGTADTAVGMVEEVEEGAAAMVVAADTGGNA